MNKGLPTYGVFLGVGGIGMSALARYFNSKGVHVWGYDKTATDLTKQLQDEGIAISTSDEIAEVPAAMLGNLNNTWVIYTPAMPVTSKLLNYFKSSDVRMMKRAGLLGELSIGMDTFAIAGTHGKTTSTTLAAWVLENSKNKGNAILGGVSTNFNSNLVLNPSSNKLAVEADEFDRSFLTLSPNRALITATDPDHLDIYKTKEAFLVSFQAFADLVAEDGLLVVNEGADIQASKATIVRYGWNEGNDYYPTNCHYFATHSTFDLVTPNGVLTNFTLSMGGKHNLMNAAGVTAIMLNWGVSEKEIKQAFSTFKGIKRRFEIVCDLANGGVFIDDYAHHPQELDAAIGAVRSMFPAKRITGVFQPHLYSRTQDFVEEFAVSLSGLDDLLLLDIYPAREEPIEGVTADWLLNKVRLDSKQKVTKEELVDAVVRLKPEVLMTLGAGDIDRLVKPLKDAMAI